MENKVNWKYELAIEDYTSSDLTEIKAVIEDELNKRKVVKRQALVDKMLIAIKEFREEFPSETCWVSCWDSSHDWEIDVDAGEVLDELIGKGWH